MKKLYKIMIIAIVGSLILWVIYGYITIFGNPVVKLVAGHSIKKYAKLKYPESYSIEKVNYNFKNQTYIAKLVNHNKEDIRISYRKNNISDETEREKIDNKLNKELNNLLKKTNFIFDDIFCTTYVCINKSQKFDSIQDLERYDIILIMISGQSEISKKTFADMIIDIIPEIKANIFYKEKSEISIMYSFIKEKEPYYMKFTIKGTKLKLTKEYIMKNTTIENSY